MYEGRDDVGAAATIQADLDLLGDELRLALAMKGLAPHASPLFQPWSLFVAVQPQQTVAVFAQHSGTPRILYLDHTEGVEPAQNFANQIAAELNAKIVAIVMLDPPGTDEAIRADHRAGQVAGLAATAERDAILGRLGDLTGLTHIEPALRIFLQDHPDPDSNVFIMMRFVDTPQFQEIHQTIVATLAERGLHGVRADDRAYHGDVWSNVEVYLIGCHLGIAVFEDLEHRDHNPNVALELGYMKAKQRRSLILKERTLPAVPTDVVGALYKPFDKFKINETVRSEVARWIEVDLGIK
jgi:hypothetical protein